MRVLVHDARDHAVDVAKADAALQESLHRHFVGRIEQGRRGAARFKRLEGQRQAGKARKIGLVKLQGANAGQVELGHAGLYALGKCEGVGDRGAHVGVAQFGDDGAIHIGHHRMDHALRMDHHFDQRGGRTEQPVRLDHFQALVHHGGRVDRNLAPHDPVRVLAGFVGGDVFERLDRAVQERTARGGQEDLGHAGRAGLARIRLRQGLENRIVLAIDRQQGGAVLVHRIHEQLAGHDQRFLVREQNFLASTGRCQGRGQAGGADDGGHHGIGVGAGGDRTQRRFAVFDLGAQVALAQQDGQAGGGIGTADHGARRTEARALLGQLFHLGMRTERIHLVSIGVTCKHVQGGHADRTGRA